MRGRPIQARKRKGTRSVSGVAERVAFACACCRSETVRPQQRAVARARLDGSSFRHARRQVRAATHPPAPRGGSRGGAPPDPLLPPRRARRTAAEPPLRRGIELAPPDADVVPVSPAHGRNTALASARMAQVPHSRRDEAGTPAGGVAHGEAAAIRSRTCGNASQRRGAPRRPASACRRVKRKGESSPRGPPPDAAGCGAGRTVAANMAEGGAAQDAPSTPRLGSGTPCAAIGFRRKASCRASLDVRRGTRRADRTGVRPPGLRAQPGARIARRCERADGRAPGRRSRPATDKPFDKPASAPTCATPETDRVLAAGTRRFV